ncbi:hypothetical protein AB0F91_27150 [Amycolatopsis sp. NPDC023774]|uniref:hypothetical protein n=1 Tax=Amycolatopsis sp. NPDC023774 TaxID=3155015 RepID=UPI0034082524
MDQSSARLLRETCEFILGRGVVDVSLSELARGIGSHNRMLLYHFGSLDALLAAAVDGILRGTTLLDRLGELLPAKGTPAERVAAAWRHSANPGAAAASAAVLLDHDIARRAHSPARSTRGTAQA